MPAKANQPLAASWHAAAPDSLKAFRIEADTAGDVAPVRSPYILRGPRKSVYLVRNATNPSLLFAVNLESCLKPGKVAGFEWFTDEGGVLKPVR